MEKPRSKRTVKPGQEKGWSKWSPDEEADLLTEIKDLSLDEIAKNHKRTVGGIYSRLCVIAVRLMEEENMTLKEVMEITKTNELDIEKQIVRNKYKKKPKDDSDEKPSPRESSKLSKEAKPEVFKGTEGELVKLRVRLDYIQELLESNNDKLDKIMAALKL